MSSADHICIVEDDTEIRELVRTYIEQNGFSVTACEGATALDRHLATGNPPSLIILDLMLPGEDGLSICRRLRATSNIPILMLTAKAEDVDRIVGLELGADDYLTKPFNPRELLARIRAILRRGQPPPPAKGRIKVGALTVDRLARTVCDGSGAEITLTSAEYDLLECFVMRPGRVLNRDQLMDWTRGREADAFDRTIDVQLSRLRKKIEPAGGEVFKTIRGQGYMMIAPVSAEDA
ncbi:MAG: response regulator [Pseudomonadota bacterium]